METPTNNGSLEVLTNAPKKIKLITIYDDEDMPVKKLDFSSPEVICLDTPTKEDNLSTPVTSPSVDIRAGLDRAPVKEQSAVSRIGDISSNEVISPRRLDYSPKDCHRVKHVFAFELLLDEFRQREIDAHNMQCENQEGLICRECGLSAMEHCHCHSFECMECYPEHFCDICGSAKYVLI